MLFHSYVFIFLFFPICLLGYYLIKHWDKTQGLLPRLWIVAVSLWFYGYMNPWYLFYLGVGILFNYGCHLAIRKWKKIPLIIGVTGNLGLLFYVKYFDFFIQNINSILKLSLTTQTILIPLGISFITFSQIAFLVDTYRGEMEDCTVLEYIFYISFFPKMIQGPITLMKDLRPSYESAISGSFSWEVFYRGLVLFILGLAKKVLIADTLGTVVDCGYLSLSNLQGADAILVMLSYTLQLYFDFSGYCDMAMGCARMLGMDLSVNFFSPYKAHNIVEFWKGWHITLTRFFKKYVYIPLGGNRKGVTRMYMNLLFIFLLSGIWHGAGYNFIIWGMMHGVLYAITKAWLLHKQNSTQRLCSDWTSSKVWVKCKSVIGVLLTFIYVNVAWVFFRATSLQDALTLLGRMLSGQKGRINWELVDGFNLDEFWYVIKLLHVDQWQYAHYIIPALFIIVCLIITFGVRNALQIAEKIKPRVITTIVLAGVFVWCVLSLSGVNTFLYVNF